MKVLEMIAKQQKGREGLPDWMVGQQLAEICRKEPECAALVEKDLDTITLKVVAEKLKIKPEPEKFRYEHPDLVGRMEKEGKQRDGKHHRAGRTGKADSGKKLHEPG